MTEEEEMLSAVIRVGKMLQVLIEDFMNEAPGDFHTIDVKVLDGNVFLRYCFHNVGGTHKVMRLMPLSMEDSLSIEDRHNRLVHEMNYVMNKKCLEDQAL